MQLASVCSKIKFLSLNEHCQQSIVLGFSFIVKDSFYSDEVQHSPGGILILRAKRYKRVIRFFLSIFFFFKKMNTNSYTDGNVG